MIRLFIALLLVTLFTFNLLSVSWVSSEECLPEPLSGLQQNRWDIVSDCVTITGVVAATDLDYNAQDQNWWALVVPDTEYRHYWGGDDGPVWVKFYQRILPAHPEQYSRVRITGALVDDLTWGWREIVPVWSLEVVEDDVALPSKPPSVSIAGIDRGRDVYWTIVVSNYMSGPLNDLVLELVDEQSLLFSLSSNSGMIYTYSTSHEVSEQSIKVRWLSDEVTVSGKVIGR